MRWTATACILAGLNALLMILLMMWSVFSLATSADIQVPQVAALVTTISLGLALFSAMGTVFARLARFQAIQLAKRQMKHSDAIPNNQQQNGRSPEQERNTRPRRRRS